MRKYLLVLLVASAGVSGPAVAKDKKPFDPNKQVCRRYETTGSLLDAKRICHTAAEWARIDQGNNDIARSATDPVGRFGGFAERRN